VSTHAMERQEDRSPDVARAAQRLGRPRARVSLAFKRACDVLLALVMLVALLPLLILVVVLLILGGRGWVEKRERLGRDGRSLVLTRFVALPGGAFGHFLEQIGARELPLLFAVLRGRLSFVGPRPLPPDSGSGYTGPRRLMAPGLVGPAQRGSEGREADSLDDDYVATWTLRRDAQLLFGRASKVAHHSVSKSSS
jgi:lipopolysaccharide/colanic/teichoic acid biosynthesis glycosyltransferase